MLLDVSPNINVLSHPVVPPAGSVLDVNPQPQNQTTPTDLDPERTEGTEMKILVYSVLFAYIQQLPLGINKIFLILILYVYTAWL